MDYFTLLGFCGFGFVLSGYVCITTEILVPKSFTYALLNLTGAGLLALDALNKVNWSSVALNVVFALISIVLLAKVPRKVRKKVKR